MGDHESLGWTYVQIEMSVLDPVTLPGCLCPVLTCTIYSCYTEDARAEENSSDKVPAQCDAEPGKDCTRTPVHYQESPPAQDSPLSGNHHAGAEEESNLNPSSVDDAQSLEAFQQAFLTAASIEKDDAELWDAPIQLVRPNPKGHEELEIVEEGLKRLAQVPSPLALIAVVGKFHTGKSFLLNQVMRKQRGFGVGSTVRPETMGIWMWGKVSGQLPWLLYHASPLGGKLPHSILYFLIKLFCVKSGCRTSIRGDFGPILRVQRCGSKVQL